MLTYIKEQLNRRIDEARDPASWVFDFIYYLISAPTVIENDKMRLGCRTIYKVIETQAWQRVGHTPS